MNEKDISAALPCILVIIAGILAMMGLAGWGWFLLGAVLCY